MGQGQERLELMRANPKGDWRIADLQVVCDELGIELRAPGKGSHYKVTHSSQADIVTVPARRPIKPVYVKRFVEFVDAVRGADDDR